MEENPIPTRPPCSSAALDANLVVDGGSLAPSVVDGGGLPPSVKPVVPHPSSPEASDQQKPSFAGLFTGRRNPAPRSDISYNPISSSNEISIINFKLSDKAKLLESMKFVLVGKFSHGRPSIHVLRGFFSNLKLKGSVNISLFDDKHLFVECELKEDYVFLWLRNLWFINRFLMRMFRWTTEFEPSKESSIQPAWISFPKLPFYLYDEDSIMSIARSVREPLVVDKRTLNRTSLGVARVCVDLDVAADLVSQVRVSFKDDDTGVEAEGFGRKCAMIGSLTIVMFVSMLVILIQNVN